MKTFPTIIIAVACAWLLVGFFHPPDFLPPPTPASVSPTPAPIPSPIPPAPPPTPVPPLVPKPPEALPPEAPALEPQGTYTSSQVAGTTVTFQDDILTVSNIFGKVVGKYEITKNGRTLLFTDIVTGEEWGVTYEYIAEVDCVVLDSMKYWGEHPKTLEPEIHQPYVPEKTPMEKLELDVLREVNQIRENRGTPSLVRDVELYVYAKKHSENMAKVGDLFHTDSFLYAENAWGGSGSNWDANDIVESWMSSRKHRTWLLCPNLENIAVGIVIAKDGDMYASWTFWKNEPHYSDWWYQGNADPPDWWY